MNSTVQYGSPNLIFEQAITRSILPTVKNTKQPSQLTRGIGSSWSCRLGSLRHPPTFIGAVTCTLRPLLRECVILFFDDILVFSKTLKQHVEHLRQVLQLLRRDHWQVKQSKCAFGQWQIAYLGHVISEQGGGHRSREDRNYQKIARSSQQQRGA